MADNSILGIAAQQGQGGTPAPGIATGDASVLGEAGNEDPNQLSPNFHKSEFNQPQRPLPLDEYEVSPVLVEHLEKLRKAIGDKPITITNGYRTKEYNKLLKSQGYDVSDTSQHLESKAADITVEGITPAALKEFAKEVGFSFMKVYKGHLHVDVRDIERDK